MMKYLRQVKDLGFGTLSARWYDKNSREHRIEELHSYADEAARILGGKGTVLEIAPGPGYLAIELAKMGTYTVAGLDISKEFVAIAHDNAKKAGVNVEFRHGNVSSMPFSGNEFDFIICTAAFKNFKEPVKAISEMHRVLKPGGKVLIIDLNKNVSDADLDSLVKKMGVKGGEAVFMKWTFKYFLRQGAYSEKEFAEVISRTEFGAGIIKKNDVSLYVYLQK
jgi:ubiquinone/menaquinone biosynthesis C-methylase UbiE